MDTPHRFDAAEQATRTTAEADPDYLAATAQARAESQALEEPTEPQPRLHVPLPTVPSPEQKATQLRDVVPAAYVYGAAAGLFEDAIDLPSCQVNLHQLLQQAGNPADPITRMMLEQLAMAHHAIGRLHVRAATRASLAEVVAYHGVLARLMGEFRKTSLALRGLRQHAAEQAGGNEQHAAPDRLPTAGTVRAGEPGAAAASSRSEQASSVEGEGCERPTKCA
jgi:hypothetical protein